MADSSRAISAKTGATFACFPNSLCSASMKSRSNAKLAFRVSKSSSTTSGSIARTSAANGWCHLIRRHGRPHEKERKRRCRFLLERDVDQRFELLPEGVSLHDVRDNPDHGSPLAKRVWIPRAEPLAKRLFARPEPGGKGLVHNGDGQRRRTIAVVEVAAGSRGCAQESEVVRSGPQELDGFVAVPRAGPSLDLKRSRQTLTSREWCWPRTLLRFQEWS